MMLNVLFRVILCATKSFVPPRTRSWRRHWKHPTKFRAVHQLNVIIAFQEHERLGMQAYARRGVMVSRLLYRRLDWSRTRS